MGQSRKQVEGRVRQTEQERIPMKRDRTEMGYELNRT
jgi:hypothetical protein